MITSDLLPVHLRCSSTNSSLTKLASQTTGRRCGNNPNHNIGALCPDSYPNGDRTSKFSLFRNQNLGPALTICEPPLQTSLWQRFMT